MRAHVYVTLKTTVLDAQGQTIANALRRLHHPQVESVRQGKYFVLTLADSLTGDAARAEVERIAADVLTNPVIEDFTYKLTSSFRSLLPVRCVFSLTSAVLTER